MVFSSMLFVFLFFALNALSQILIKNITSRNISMLIFSLVFYSWGGPRYLFLLVGMTFVCWIGGLLVEKYYIRGRFFLTVTIVICLIILGIFKYTGLVLGTSHAIFGIPEVVPEIVLPIGISFYTFQLISYVIDVYRGETPAERQFWILLLYSSLFHQCVAGPIVRYKDVRLDIRDRQITLNDISQGISRFSVGLAKKAILANSCAVVADSLLVFDKDQLSGIPATGILLGAFAFTLQIYLDFSAYSDMAIGMGLMSGLHYRENFNYPYIAESITDFWRRWHISLSSFFRDYVYIPLGGSRSGRQRQIFNLFVVWALTGLWHGAHWNFVLWGLYFFVLICLQRFWAANIWESIHDIGKHIIVGILILFGWIIFKFTDLGLLFTAIKGLFALNGNGFGNSAIWLILKNNLILLIVSTIACTPIVKIIKEYILERYQRTAVGFWAYSVWDLAHPAILLIVSAMALVGESYNPFLYFQF